MRVLSPSRVDTEKKTLELRKIANGIHEVLKVSWSPGNHFYYPSEARKRIFRVLYIWHLYPESPIASLPKDIIMYILSLSEVENRFRDCLFPDRFERESRCGDFFVTLGE